MPRRTEYLSLSLWQGGRKARLGPTRGEIRISSCRSAPAFFSSLSLGREFRGKWQWAIAAAETTERDRAFREGRGAGPWCVLAASGAAAKARHRTRVRGRGEAAAGRPFHVANLQRLPALVGTVGGGRWGLTVREEASLLRAVEVCVCVVSAGTRTGRTGRASFDILRKDSRKWRRWRPFFAVLSDQAIWFLAQRREKSAVC